MFAIGQSNFLQALGWAVLNSLWQMALLWVVYQVVTAIFRKSGSSGKSMLATTLLFSGFAWFVLTFFVTLTGPGASHDSYAGFMSLDRNEQVYSWLYTMLPIASVAYLVLLVLPVLNFIRNYRYVQVIRRHGLRKADVKWRMFVQDVSARMGINKPVHIWLSDLVTSPVTIGFLKPIILLPVAAVNHLTSDQVEAVLLHELSHIRRFDFLLNMISKAIKTILYFNPFVRAFARIIETEREKNCDEIVLQFQYEPHGYASALLTLEKAACTVNNLAVAAAGDKRKDLLGRIETILGTRKKPVFSFNKLAGVLAALLCFISLNALLLLSKPGETKLKPGLLSDLSKPFQFFTPTYDARQQGQALAEVSKNPEAAVETEVAKGTIINIPGHATQELQASPVTPDAPEEPAELEVLAATTVPEPAHPEAYRFVNFAEKLLPELSTEEQKQVELALEASKKVMTEDQWRLLEKGIADAMNSHEKEKLKLAYKKAMNKVDWEKMEERLKLQYEQINWNQVNMQLQNALTEIKLDSLQDAYTAVLSELSTIQKELKEQNQTAVPDSDITLKVLEGQKTETIRVINKIKSVRNRKIVHL